MEGREARGGEEKGGVRLFGVTICGGGAAEEAEGGDGAAGVEAEVMRKSKSMSNLASAAENGASERGYLSDGALRKSGRRRRRAGAAGHERKKGIPWTEEEHRTFLEGLEKLGKGDWRGISRKFVITRTPTQVASHAQKYFIRQLIPSNKKRRSSLFDVVINDSASTSETVPTVFLNQTQKGSKEINILRQDNKKVGAPELNSGLSSSPGPERLPNLHFMAKCVGVSEPKNFNRMEGKSGFMEDKPMSIEPPKVSQMLSLRLDAPQSAVSSKMHANKTTLSQEFKMLPCRPCQVNTIRQAAEGSDLDLSIAPPKPHSLRKAPPQNGFGAVRVV